MREAIISAVREVKANTASRFLPVAEVKEKAVLGAINKYTTGCTAADVVALMDVTLFGSGKEGFLLTETHLYGSHFNEKNGIELQGLKSVRLEDGNYLIFNWQDGRKVRYFASIFAPYVCEVLQKIISGAGTAEKTKSEGDAPPAGSLEADIAQRLAQQKKADGEIPAAGEQPVETGLRELKAGHYEAARSAFRAAADQGDAEGAYQLGLMCHEGQGAEKDDAQAVEWYRKAAQQGHAQAQNALGRMYDKAWGVARNYSEAFHWYRLAAQQGLAVAQFNVGNMYYSGDGVAQDYSMAREWYQKAAAQGNAKAMYGLGLIYEKGKGVEKDAAEAVKWYRLSDEKGYEKAKEAVERLEKPAEDPKKSEKTESFSSLEEAIARRLAGQGVGKEPEKPEQEETPAPKPEEVDKKPAPVVLPSDPEAARLFSEGLREYRSGNYTAASRDFQKAANLDHPYAWFNLAVMYDMGRGVPRNLTTALRWYLKAAEAGIPEAQFNTAQMYYLGEGTDADPAKAFPWYLKAAEAGVAGAQAMVGAIYRDGKLTGQDLAEARRWLQKAADQGLEAAQEALKSI